LKPPKMGNYLLRRAKSKFMLKEIQDKDEALTKIQLKIMDIAPPLIELAARMRKYSDERKFGKSFTNGSKNQAHGRSISAAVRRTPTSSD
jgi:hypothetical protein